MGWSGRAPALPWGDARPMSGLPPESGRVALISGRLRCAITGREQSQQDPRLFDHLVGAHEQRRRHVEAERLRGLEVQKQFRFTSPRDARAPNAL
jgi:hypothetical protein